VTAACCSNPTPLPAPLRPNLGVERLPFVIGWDFAVPRLWPESPVRSMVAHLALKHGISPSQVQERMRQHGIKVGDTMLYAAQSLNLFKEVRKGGDHLRRDTLSSRGKMQMTRDAASAEAHKILHDFKESTGRRLAGTDDDTPRSPHFPNPDEQSREAKLNTLRYGLRVYNGPKQREMDPELAAYAMWRHYNATKALGPSFRSLERSAQDSRRDRRRMISKASQHPKLKARTSLENQRFGTQLSTFSIMRGTLGALQASEGSLLRRLGPAVQAMESMRERHNTIISDALNRRERRRMEHDGRRLAEKPIDPENLYKKLDERTKHQRHMHVELRGDHALSWVHDLVGGGAGWRDIHTESKRIADVEQKRHLLREEGKMTHAQIAEMHPIGYDRLDRNSYKPSILGDFFRRLAARKTTGNDPAWIKPRWWSFQARRRRLSEEQTTEIPVSTARRLGQAFFEGVVDAPFAFRDTPLPSGVIVEQSTTSIWAAGLRYIVYVRLQSHILLRAYLV